MSEKIEPTAEQVAEAMRIQYAAYGYTIKEGHPSTKFLATALAERDAALAKVAAFGEVARDAYARLEINSDAFSSDICDRLEPYLPPDKPTPETVLADSMGPKFKHLAPLVLAQLAKRGAKVVVEDGV
jgi:hypothetical protein